MTASNRPNFLLLLIDALPYLPFNNMPHARALMPNICALIKDGFLHPLIANGGHTQMAIAPVFTQTYPLDYDGYNCVVRTRPISCGEALQEHGYITHQSVSGYINGPMWNTERGFDHVTNLYDRYMILQKVITHYLVHELDLWEQGEQTKEQFIETMQKEFGQVLSYTGSHKYRINDLRLPQQLRAPSKKVHELFEAERRLLHENPDAIINKIKNIPHYLYKYYLGKEGPDWKLPLLKWFYRWRIRGNTIIRTITRISISYFPLITIPTAGDMVRAANRMPPDNSKPWFYCIHFMDIHENRSLNRPLNFLFKFLQLPRLLWLRHKNASRNTILFELTLIYLDRQIGKLLKQWRKRGLLENTRIVLTADHGGEWNRDRDIKLVTHFGFRSFPERNTIPFILTPHTQKPNTGGQHDSMSIFATIMDIVGIPQHSSFKGISVFERGRDICVSETCDRGHCDVKRKDLFFTVVSKQYRLMARLSGNQLRPHMLFDRVADPIETVNVIGEKQNGPIINDLMTALYQERKELMLARRVEPSSW